MLADWANVRRGFSSLVTLACILVTLAACILAFTCTQVSQVVGRGFSSLFTSYVGVMSALEEGRPLLLLCVGTRGMVPMRALLNWTPVQAHATAHKVTLLYVTK